MEDPAVGQLLALYKYTFIAAHRGRGNYVLIERKWNEDNQGQEIDDCADCSHSFRTALHIERQHTKQNTVDPRSRLTAQAFLSWTHPAL